MPGESKYWNVQYQLIRATLLVVSPFTYLMTPPLGRPVSLLAPFPLRPLTSHLWTLQLSFLLTRILSAICWICWDFVWMSSFSLFSLRSMVSSLFTLFSREWRRSCRSWINQRVLMEQLLWAYHLHRGKEPSRGRHSRVGKKKLSGTWSNGEDDNSRIRVLGCVDYKSAFIHSNIYQAPTICEVPH